MITERIGFQTAAQLVKAIEALACGVINLDEVYVRDVDGAEFGRVALAQDTLSDGSVVFDLVLEYEGDPNS